MEDPAPVANEPSATLDAIPWKNRVKDEPLDYVKSQLFVSWCGGIDKCLLCGATDDCFECEFEWGDTKQFEHFRELCGFCLIGIMKDCRNMTPEKLANFKQHNEIYTRAEIVAKYPGITII